MSKEELTEKILNTLGLDLDSLSRVTKKDLEALYKAISGEKEETSEIEEDLLKRPLREILNSKLLGKPIGELTIIELLETFLTRKGGPLGLGILPAILEGRRKR